MICLTALQRLFSLSPGPLRNPVERRTWLLKSRQVAPLGLPQGQQELLMRERVHRERALLRQRHDIAQRRIEDFQDLLNGPPDLLRRKLKDDDPNVRLATINIVGQRWLHIEKDLIARLDDRSRTVQQAARQALVRLSRGTDFGPEKHATKVERRLAMRRWLRWLGNQDSELVRTHTFATTSSPPAVGPQGWSSLADVSHVALTPVTLRSVILQNQDAQVVKLCTQFVDAPPKEQDRLLNELRDHPGVAYSDALAAAIPQLPAPVAEKAREALAKRMQRMSIATLRDKFHDDSEEVRRAAAVAVAAKKCMDLIPDLLDLLNDPEPPVVQATRTALKQLTAQDFGPEPESDLTTQKLSVAAWRDWWKTRREGPRKHARAANNGSGSSPEFSASFHFQVLFTCHEKNFDSINHLGNMPCARSARSFHSFHAPPPSPDLQRLMKRSSMPSPWRRGDSRRLDFHDNVSRCCATCTTVQSSQRRCVSKRARDNGGGIDLLQLVAPAAVSRRTGRLAAIHQSVHPLALLTGHAAWGYLVRTRPTWCRMCLSRSCKNFLIFTTIAAKASALGFAPWPRTAGVMPCASGP